MEECFGVEVEVEFQEFYKKQPLFCDIDVFLKKNGFQLVDFRSLDRAFLLMDKNNIRYGEGQIFSGNAIYFKDVKAITNWNLKSILPGVAICIAYNKIDHAIRLINILEVKKIIEYDDIVNLKRAIVADNRILFPKSKKEFIAVIKHLLPDSVINNIKTLLRFVKRKRVRGG